MSDPAPVTVEEHLARVLAAVGPLKPAEVPLLEALGLVCVEDVASPVSLPPFDNSAMDGYALRAADAEGATSEHPVRLRVVGEIGAGHAGAGEVAPGTAAKIMTGAPLPPGADTVAPYEWTDRGAATVRLDRGPESGAHVRRAGEDVRAGEVVLAAGTVLGPRHLGLLASVGHAVVRARPRPRVAIVSTGSELTPPGQPLGEASIYDGNSYLLAAAALRAGAEPVRVGIVPDRPDAFLAELDALLAGERGGPVHAVVTSGGVSQGDFDVVKEALRPRGEVWFGPVAMQPGKPQGFGVVRGVPVFTLPGNPVSSYLSFELFVLPALRTMAGLAPVSRPPVDAVLAEPLRSPAGRRQFLRGHLDTATGRAHLVGGAGSHLVGGLAAADALVVVPEDVTALEAGDPVQVIRLDLDPAQV